MEKDRFSDGKFFFKINFWKEFSLSVDSSEDGYFVYTLDYSFYDYLFKNY